MPQQIVKGQRFGKWELRKPLGEGGNGFVWLAQDSVSCCDAAIKILAKIDGKSKSKMYARFASEVKVVQDNSDIEGLLPIVDSYLPDDNIANDLPWYAMPVAQALKGHYDYEAAIQLTLEVARILAKLHERGISHRDIKPANILVWNGKFCLGDFGLVDYPEKPDLTSTGEQIGAKWTMAPEMKRNSTNADGKPADVYSLAKTLWILITGRKYGFEGQYNSEGVNGLGGLKLTERNDLGFYSRQPPLIYTKPLDELLRICTDDNPLHRPTMSQFIEQLSSWITTYKDFTRYNPLQWQDVQTKLFPTYLPQRAFWDSTADIIGILNYLGSIDSLNHMLLPYGGGMDMLGAKRGVEPDTIELIINDRTVYVVRPKKLVFESFGSDWEWNYFRLETGDLAATGINMLYRSRENLIEIAPLQYISEAKWDRDRNDENQYPANSRRVSRYINGDFLILQKTSTYNRSSYTYDGRHNQMGTDEFRNYISNKVQLVQQMQQDKRLTKLVSERGQTLDDVIFDHLDSVFRQEVSDVFPRKPWHKGYSS